MGRTEIKLRELGYMNRQKTNIAFGKKTNIGAFIFMFDTTKMERKAFGEILKFCKISTRKISSTNYKLLLTICKETSR